MRSANRRMNGVRLTNGMSAYNGFTANERLRKLQAMYRLFPRKSHPYYHGACHLCGDPDSPVVPHDEDYSLPYVWQAPAVRALCNWCHRRIHARFTHANAWEAYLRHESRGGYGSDLGSPDIRRQIMAVVRAISNGEAIALDVLRDVSPRDCWWERLSLHRHESVPNDRPQRERTQS